LDIKIAVLGLRGSHYGRAKPLIGVIGPDSTALWRTRKRSPLVDKTALNFNLSEVSADKAYLGADNMLTTLRHGAIPYIPFKSNSVAQSGENPKSTLWTRMFHFYSLRRDEFLTHYPKRSNVETTFSMIKAKFG
jgi:transposase